MPEPIQAREGRSHALEDRGRVVMSIASPTVCRSAEFRLAWEVLLSAHGNLYVLHQSPEWYDYLLDTGRDDFLPPVAVHDTEGRLIGLAPLVRRRHTLDFMVRGRVLGRLGLRTASLAGSVPLLPADPELYDRLFAAIAEAFPHCDAIHLGSVPTDSFCWEHVRGSRWLQHRFHVYIPDRVRPCYSLNLPATFEQYMAKFPGKTRYNLRRQVRRLREHGDGVLRLERIEAADQVPAFLEAVGAIAPKTWQSVRRLNRELELSKVMARPERLAELARRGLLRSYVLRCGATPCAFVLGTQYRDVYHYVQVGYDPTFSRFSPGTVLLSLLVEDLLRHRPPGRVNFGVGDLDYKRAFGNVCAEDATVLLMNRTFANAARRLAYSTFRSFVRSVKSWRRGGGGTARAPRY